MIPLEQRLEWQHRAAVLDMRPHPMTATDIFREYQQRDRMSALYLDLALDRILADATEKIRRAAS